VLINLGSWIIWPTRHNMFTIMECIIHSIDNLWRTPWLSTCPLLFLLEINAFYYKQILGTFIISTINKWSLNDLPTPQVHFIYWWCKRLFISQISWPPYWNWWTQNQPSLSTGLNEKKFHKFKQTNFIIFFSLRKRMSTIKHFYFNEIPTVKTRSSKYLGVFVDQHFTWRDHVVAVSNKIAKNMLP